MSRAADWFKQAERDLAQAEDSRCTGRHERTCFAAHQATEKSVKALHLHTFYIPSRCPNSHPEGAPFERYGPLQSGEAPRFAGAIIEFVRRRLA